LAADFPTIPAGLIAYDEKQNVELTTGEVNLVSPSSRRLRWLVGVYGASSSQKFTPRLEHLATGQHLYGETREDHLNDIAPFAEISYDLNDQWTVIAGARLSTFDHETESRIHQITATGAVSATAFNQSLKSSQFSHKLVARFRPRADLMMYLQAAEGYRGGGFNTGSLVGSAPIPGHYHGDELISYEAGVKYNPPGGRLHLGLAAFKLLWHNIQSDQIQSTGLPVTVNIGDGVNQGIEIEVVWRASAQLTFYGAAMLNDPHLTRPNRLYVTAEDSGLPDIAHQTANLRARFETLVWQHDWVSEADLHYQGVSHLDFGPLQIYKMGGYATLNLSSTLTMGSWKISVRADNLLGARANTLAYGNPFTLRLGPQSAPLRPATFWVSVARHF
jgi:outer membrane receptor protein involved in Fe transport